MSVAFFLQSDEEGTRRVLHYHAIRRLFEKSPNIKMNQLIVCARIETGLKHGVITIRKSQIAITHPPTIYP